MATSAADEAERVTTRERPAPSHRKLRRKAAFTNWLTERMQELGYKRLAAFADAHSFEQTTLHGWVKGKIRPSLSQAREIAAAFKVEVEPIVEHMWRAKQGSLCPCGCGGKAIMPDEDTRRTYAIRRACAECGEIRIYPSMGNTNAHGRHCSAHAGVDREPLVDRITLTCVGYKDLGKKRASYTPKCLGTHAFIPNRLTAVIRQSSQAEHPWDTSFYDTDSGTFRCGRCSTASMSLYQRLEGAKALTKTRIRTKDKLREIEVEHRRVLFPNSQRLRGLQAKGPRPAQAGVPRSDETIQAVRVGRVRAGWLRGHPDWAVAHCQWCRKLILYTPRADEDKRGREYRFHKACAIEARQSPAGRIAAREKQPLPSAPAGRGRPCSSDHLRDFTWAMLHYVCDLTFQDIAERYGFSAAGVEKQVRHIMENLPEPHLVTATKRLHFELLYPLRRGDAELG